MSRRDPAIGFISLGCPKALVDSERILTQLRVEGYRIVNNYEKADAVVVNTCGFIESAVQESLDAIGEALHENGKVIVTGCLGKRADLIREAYPEVQAISGPQDYASVMHAVHALLPPRHDPLLDLLPPTGIKLTPRHYAYLKISEGCNHRCSFCIIPSLRGDLASRPVDAVLAEAEALVRTAPERCGVPARVVRLSGLYGPGRAGTIERVRSGALALGPGDGAFMNFCHLEDAVAFALGALARGAPGAVYHGTDASPPRRREVVAWIAARLGIEPPRSAGPGDRAGPDRRVSSVATRAALGIALRFPTFRDGFEPLLPR